MWIKSPFFFFISSQQINIHTIKKNIHRQFVKKVLLNSKETSFFHKKALHYYYYYEVNNT